MFTARIAAQYNVQGQLMGIPVPGQGLGGLDAIQFFIDACQGQTDVISNTLNLLAGTRGAEVAQRIYSNLFAQLGPIDLDKLLGKWYKVVDSPAMHSESCSVIRLFPGSKSKYLTTITTKEYFRFQTALNGSIGGLSGYISKTGDDPGNLLYYTGHATDVCPYLLVRVGPVDGKGKYSYAIWTQLLKQPLMIYARDWREFNAIYRQEVETFLHQNGYLTPIVQKHNLVKFLDYKQCPTKDFYDY